MTDTATTPAPTKTQHDRSKSVKPLKLIALGFVIAAIIKELRLPKEQRTWNGMLVGFVPYDFRRPTIERIRNTFWDPAGKVLVGRPFGVGWTINAGAVVAKLRSASPAD
jgi:hypothetical protein